VSLKCPSVGGGGEQDTPDFGFEKGWQALCAEFCFWGRASFDPGVESTASPWKGERSSGEGGIISHDCA